jgi:hypothetical protein
MDRFRNEGANDSAGFARLNRVSDADNALLMHLCSRMARAIGLCDKDRAWCFMEAARAFACGVLDSIDILEINKASLTIEADMQNHLWEFAVRSGAYFTDVIRRAIDKTNQQN